MLILRPSEIQQLDQRPRPHEGYEGVAWLVIYGGLMPVDRVMPGPVNCTGNSQVNSEGDLFLECTSVGYVKFKSGDSTVKQDGVQWLPITNLVLEISNSPRKTIGSEELEPEGEILKSIFQALTERIDSRVGVWRNNCPGNPQYGALVIQSRRDFAPPSIEYRRFDSANLHRNHMITGKRKDWEMECCWQYDAARLAEVIEEVATFVEGQVQEVTAGLAQIVQLQN
ncbi:hypothetical protein [Phormidesmis priestleyi]|uniref:hypothetical protein n=1 Tax=Phormidesmis priestleyi TaxID=268141 RepID=UPI00083B1CAE|nr:hypothetical protein [Phormidesmis priestleyi]